MRSVINIPEIFGCDVFNEATMKQRLPAHIFQAWRQCVMHRGTRLEPDVAQEIAEAMKLWAIEKGATHYTHWFLPLTGSMAEKHDSFLELKDGKPIMAFSGKTISPESIFVTLIWPAKDGDERTPVPVGY